MQNALVIADCLKSERLIVKPPVGPKDDADLLLSQIPHPFYRRACLQDFGHQSLFSAEYGKAIAAEKGAPDLL